jgi:hypothetical protein
MFAIGHQKIIAEMLYRQLGFRLNDLGPLLVSIYSSDMFDRDQVFVQLADLDLPSDAFVVVGSAVLAVHQLRTADDIDLLVSPAALRTLEERGWPWRPGNDYPLLRVPPFEASSHWGTGDFRPDSDRVIREAERISGWPFVSLSLLAQWKQAAGRPKDFRDLTLIAQATAERS